MAFWKLLLSACMTFWILEMLRPCLTHQLWLLAVVGQQVQPLL
jgi:hypothetical protein